MTERKVVQLSTLKSKSRKRGPKKLKQWVPVLSWEKPAPTEEFWIRREYGNPTEEEFEEMIEDRNAKLAKQHSVVDKMMEDMNIRKQEALRIKNQKEVRIKL